MKWHLVHMFALVAATFVATPAAAGFRSPECTVGLGAQSLCEWHGQTLIHYPEPRFSPCADELGRSRGCVDAPVRSDVTQHSKPVPRCATPGDRLVRC